MKQLLIFLALLSFALLIDTRPVRLDQKEKDTILVEIQGAVVNGGNIELPVYSTIDDLLEKVELKDDADLSALNGSTILKDHDIVRIPCFDADGSSSLISINTADAETLMTLPGIGQTTAERIIAERSSSLFQSTEDLMRVKGIGQAKFDKLKDLICL